MLRGPSAQNTKKNIAQNQSIDSKESFSVNKMGLRLCVGRDLMGGGGVREVRWEVAVSRGRRLYVIDRSPHCLWKHFMVIICLLYTFWH